MKKPLLIGISGRKRHGKDSLAQALKLRLNDCCHINFADALKTEVCQATGIPRAKLEEQKDHFRLILQGWGTDFRRKLCGDNYWVKQFERTYELATEFKLKYALVSDVRFKNELDYIKSNGGITIRINRPGFPSDDTHVSETELDGETFDFFYSCETLDAIDKAAESFCNYLKTKQ